MAKGIMNALSFICLVGGGLTLALTCLADGRPAPENDSAASVVRAYADTADTILLCSEKKSVFITESAAARTKCARVFRVVDSLRGAIPPGAILRYSDHYSELWAPPGVTRARCGNDKEETFVSRKLAGQLFFAFLDSSKIQKSDRDEYVYDICSDGPFWGNPLPANDQILKTALEKILVVEPPCLRPADIPASEIDASRFPLEHELCKSIEAAEDVILAALAEEKIFFDPQKRRWIRQRLFRVIESTRGEIPFNAKFKITDAPPDEIAETADGPVLKASASEEICLKNDALSGELFYLFPLKGKIRPPANPDDFYEYEETRRPPAIPFFLYLSDAHREILEKRVLPAQRKILPLSET